MMKEKEVTSVAVARASFLRNPHHFPLLMCFNLFFFVFPLMIFNVITSVFNCDTFSTCSFQSVCYTIYIYSHHFFCVGNLITIIALIKHQKLRGHATTAFVLSLCISDLLFCSFSMPLTAIRYFNKVCVCLVIVKLLFLVFIRSFSTNLQSRRVDEEA